MAAPGTAGAWRDNHQIAVNLTLAPWLVRRQLASIYGVLPLGHGKNKRAAAATWYLTVGRALRDQEAS
jgi:hypothetical protein